MAFWDDLTGILGGALQFGKGGPWVKNLSGVLTARNAGDTDVAPLFADHRNVRCGAAYGNRLWPKGTNNVSMTGTLTLTANTWYAVPYPVGYDVPALSLSALVTSTVSGAKVRLGVLEPLANGAPGAVVAQTGELSGAFALEISGGITSYQPTVPYVYVSILSDSAIAVRTGVVPRDNPLAGIGSGGSIDTYAAYCTASQTYGALPSAYPTSGFTILKNNNGFGPFVFFNAT
jgi:hypothetical protein